MNWTMLEYLNDSLSVKPFVDGFQERFRETYLDERELVTGTFFEVDRDGKTRRVRLISTRRSRECPPRH